MKSVRQLCRILLTSALWAWALGLWMGTAQAADERILLEATINGKPARLALDTGASHLILFKRGAERLGLKVTKPPREGQQAPGQVPLGRTEPCDCVLGTSRARTSLGVFEPPSS